jgi:hypothetical protein
MSKQENSDGVPARRTNDIGEWYAAQYLSSVGLDAVEGGAKFKRFAATLPVVVGPEGPILTGGRSRMGNFLSLKLRYPLSAQGYSCLVLTAQTGTTEAHYAYVYWRRGAKERSPEYICISPTFDSRDGEYRRRFIRYPIFGETYSRKAQELAPFEESILSLIAQGTLTVKATVYPEDAAAEVSERAHDTRLMITTFATALIIDLWEHEQGLLMVHTNLEYQSLVKHIATLQPTLVGLSRKAHSTPPGLSLFLRGDVDQLAVQCGQKLVPMFEREAMQPFDYNLAVWRELAVTKLVGDLVLNFISPSFALYNQWTYVEGADQGLFENPPMEERYVRGRAVERAARSLREARQAVDSEDDVSHNYHTGELSARIYESLEYAQSYLLISSVVLAHTMEDVGWSLRSLEAYARRAPTQWPAVLSSFADLDSAARLIFEPCYAAHCLHTKLGVAHTDIHGNNLTFYMWGLADQQRPVKGSDLPEYTPYYDSPVVLYVAGPRGEADSYLFPAAGNSCCLIDYSRCILGPGFRPRLDEGRAPQYAMHYYRDQVSRVMRTLHRYAPSIVEKNEAAIKAAVLANFEAVFPVLCAVDFVAIGRSIKSALTDAMASASEHDVRPFTIAKTAVDLAAKLETAAFELFVVGLRDLAESAGSRQQMPPPAFPGASLLEKVFSQWSFQRWALRDSAKLRKAQLVDSWNFQNKLRFAGDDYARWPPWARLDVIEKHLGEYRLGDLFERGVEPFLEALKPGARVEIIAERLRAESERLDGKPAATASSWLDE